MNPPFALFAMVPVVDAFEQLGVPYYIGGSVASLHYGIYRTTADADLIANLRVEHVKPLVRLLKGTYYIDEDMIRDAIQHRSEFNVLHLETMFKVDVFIQKARSFDQEVRRRVQRNTLKTIDENRLFYLESPEDVILNKLEWYKMGGGVSDRQWNDILGVLKVQGATLDIAYLRKWAATLDVTELLDRALEDAGL
ncbi:MAG TPA: hypothetical protein VJ761_06870 [Ktedonobacteraceae bacterium]|nr:hypothetical protein [Ktedonobacteraceae bacterium]